MDVILKASAAAMCALIFWNRCRRHVNSKYILFKMIYWLHFVPPSFSFIDVFHSVEKWKFFYHSYFTWNQFWWILRFKSAISFRAFQKGKIVILDFNNAPKLISRKICLAWKSANFHTVSKRTQHGFRLEIGSSHLTLPLQLHIL